MRDQASEQAGNAAMLCYAVQCKSHADKESQRNKRDMEKQAEKVEAKREAERKVSREEIVRML
jgi:hypothetical protein